MSEEEGHMSEETVRERADVDEGQIVMPFYLVCDVSCVDDRRHARA